jgi:hypothetical protein
MKTICKTFTAAFGALALGLLFVPHATAAAQSEASSRTALAATAPTAVPPLVPYAGLAVDGQGRPLGSPASITFLIYKDETGGEPLFTETQSVSVDTTGHYRVQLGGSSPNGLPTELFATGEARWLEIQIAGQRRQARVLLASVPYALKASDAATLGGLPASAFALAGNKSTPAIAVPAGATPDANETVTTTGGTTGYLPVFTGTNTIADSILFSSSTGIGVGDVPNSTAVFDVNGKSIWRGLLNVSRAGNATTTTGFDSYPLLFQASAYNSSTNAATLPEFELQAEPSGNDTATPGATFNLLYNANGGVLAETGLSFNANGTIKFAPGQTFPGTGITGTVNASSYDLGGTPFATGSVSAANAYLGFAGNPSSTGYDNTGVGYQSLADDTSGYDNAAAGNGALFHNTAGHSNAAFGRVSLYSNTTGNYNTATGWESLYANTTGTSNTATGVEALRENTTGGGNTAAGFEALYSDTTGGGNAGTGYEALYYNQTGTYNTAIGTYAGPDFLSTGLGDATAIGAYATVSQSNSLVLGQTTAGSPGTSFVNVGIGTATPRSTLEAVVNAPNALGPTLTLTNSGGTTDSSKGYAGTSIDFDTYYHPSTPYTNPTGRILAQDDSDYGTNLFFFSKVPGSDSNGLGQTMVITSIGDVGVTGTLSASAKTFKIDHPLDPANKFLVHASVESSEMMNIYTGNVTTDELGLATIKLPDWFEAENADFRYQLTVLGQFAQAIVKDKIANGQFRIMTNTSHVEVSWQITAVRQDAFAKAHPLVVEQTKSASEHGLYLHPELYGHTAEKQIGAAHHMNDQPTSAVDKHFPVLARPEVKLSQPKAPASLLKPEARLQPINPAPAH